MNLRWLWFDHIPPELEVPKEARWVVNAIAKQWHETKPELLRRVKRTRTLFAIACYAAFVLVSVAPILAFGQSRNARLASSVILSIAIWTVAAREIAYWRRPYVLLALCHLGYLCCVKCGYAHTGLSRDVKECPECGGAREFGKCIHCNAPQDWPMTPHDKCTQCGRLRLS